MKKVFTIIAISVSLIGCNFNQSKESRIKKLESEIQQSMKKINLLEKRIETLQEFNEKLQLKIEKTGSNRFTFLIVTLGAYGLIKKTSQDNVYEIMALIRSLSYIQVS